MQYTHINKRTFYAHYSVNDESFEFPMELVNISNTHLFFKYDSIDNLVLEKQSLRIIFVELIKNTEVPLEFTVQVLKSRVHKSAVFFATFFPLKFCKVQRRLHVRYPVYRNNFSHFEILYTNTLFILKDEWKEISDDKLILGDISAGGMQFCLCKEHIDDYVIKEGTTIILKCGFKLDRSVLAFVIRGNICGSRLEANGTCSYRVKFSEWTYDEYPQHWRRISDNQGIDPLAKFLFYAAYNNKKW